MPVIIQAKLKVANSGLLFEAKIECRFSIIKMFFRDEIEKMSTNQIVRRHVKYIRCLGICKNNPVSLMNKKTGWDKIKELSMFFMDRNNLIMRLICINAYLK